MTLPFLRECLHCGRKFRTFRTSPVQWCKPCVERYHAEIARLILEKGSDGVQAQAVALDRIIKQTELEW